jgi:tetratricopeptide (TPR) repeat protein
MGASLEQFRPRLQEAQVGFILIQVNISRSLFFKYLNPVRKYTDSIEFYRKALSLHPTNASTWTSIGLTSIFLNKFDEAIEYFHQVDNLIFMNSEKKKIL